MSVRQKTREQEEAEEQNSVKTETISVELDDDAPERSENPLARIETGQVDLPSVTGWSCSGTRYLVDENVYEVKWSGENIQVPGVEESEHAIVVLEHSSWCPNEPFDTGFAVSVVPFDGEKEPVGGMIPTTLHVGTYKRLSVALGNVENVLERLESMEPGDEIILNEKLYTL